MLDFQNVDTMGELLRVKGGGQKPDCTVQLLLAAPPYHESTLSVDTAS